MSHWLDVAAADLCHIWQDTTQISGVWDGPIYEEFLRAVRTINQSLTGNRRVRVLLGAPPLDWDEGRRSNERPATERDGKIRLHGMWIDKAEASTAIGAGF